MAIEVAPGTVVFYSDVGCPWGSLAVHRFRSRRRELGLDGRVVLDHRCFPLELVNGRLTPKPVLDVEVAVLGAHDPEVDWQPWTRPEREYPSTTLLPLEAVQAAKAQSLQLSEDLDAALRRAWYGEARPVHLFAEVIRIAGTVDGLDPTALERALAEGSARSEVFAQARDAAVWKVQGSPHLYLPDGTDVHNPGLTKRWSRGDKGGLPVIDADDFPASYDDILRRAAG